MERKLEGKVARITGSGRGIGKRVGFNVGKRWCEHCSK